MLAIMFCINVVFFVVVCYVFYHDDIYTCQSSGYIPFCSVRTLVILEFRISKLVVSLETLARTRQNENMRRS